MDSSLIANDYSVIRVGYDWETAGSVTLNLNSVTYLRHGLDCRRADDQRLVACCRDLRLRVSQLHLHRIFQHDIEQAGSITVVPEPTVVGSGGGRPWRSPLSPPRQGAKAIARMIVADYHDSLRRRLGDDVRSFREGVVYRDDSPIQLQRPPTLCETDRRQTSRS